jgi:flagellar protein FliS
MAIPDQYTITALTAGELIILLFEEASVNINKAIMHINNKDICGAHNCIVKAENIILYLNDSLDMSFPISEKLTSLYDYMYDQLVKANIKKDISILESILKMTHELKDTWEKAEISNRTSGKSR